MKNEDRYEINRRIKKIIQQEHMTEKQIAERWGVSPQVMSNIVCGKRIVYADEVMPIATALGVKVGYLLGEKEDRAG